MFLGGLLARHGKLRFEPGSRASYSSVGPLVLAAALASAAGQPFTELAGEQTLGPLGMGGTAFTVTSQMRPHAAVGYQPDAAAAAALGHRRASRAVGHAAALRS